MVAFIALLILLLTSATAQAQYPLDLSIQDFRLPRTTDKRLAEIMTSPDTVYYKLGKLYQFNSPRHAGKVAEANYLRDFNANLDFPWESTFGVNGMEHIYSAINFVYLPREAGRLKPIVVTTNTHPVKWIFPEGAVVAEILLMPHPRGGRVVFEIRTRTKTKTDWLVAVYRPIGSRKELISELKLPAYRPEYKSFLLQNPERDKVFVAAGNVEVLPPLSEAQVDHVLSLPFKEVTDEGWSPTSVTTYSITPLDYKLGLISMDNVSCQSCHRQTQISVDRLIPSETKIYQNPDLVGRIRGSDGIFTYHPFENIQADGTYQFRASDIASGRLAPYDPVRFPDQKIAYFVDRGPIDYKDDLWREHGMAGKEQYAQSIGRVGFQITETRIDSSAALAGLRRGDVIYAAEPLYQRGQQPQPQQQLFSPRTRFVRTLADIKSLLNGNAPMRARVVRENQVVEVILHPNAYIFDNAEY